MDTRRATWLLFAGFSGLWAACGAAPGEAPGGPAGVEARSSTSASPARPQVDGAPASTTQAAAAQPVPAAPAAALAIPPPAAESAPAPAARPPPPPIPPNTAVLHIGDSFAVAGFAQALGPRLKALRTRYHVKSEQSSYTVTWAAKMERLVADYQPDLVIISLGANEVANVNPPAHAPAVRRIIKSIGGRPCVWVAPPLWRKDTGIMDVIREHSAPCRFFDTDALVAGPIPRQGDKIHPNEEGGAMWVEAFWRWLEEERAREGESDAAGKAAPGRSPWALRPGPPEEHRAKGRREE